MTISMRRTLVILLLCCMAALPLGLGLLVAGAKPQTSTPPDYSQATLDGLRYDMVMGRRLDPSNPVDAQILAGVPKAERHVGKGQVLYGAFVTLANASSRARTSAARIDLRDQAMRVHHPLPIPAGNPYAYRPTTLRAGAQIPRQGTPAADDIAAGGKLLLYRVSAFQYRNGSFELVIHDPHRPRMFATALF